MNQITIFDLVEMPGDPDFKEMPLKDIAKYIGDRTGLFFIPDTRFYGDFNEYIAYYKSNVFFTVGISRYETLDERNGKPFIEVGYESKNDKSGCGMPCNSFFEAICFFKRFLTTQ